MSQFFLTLCSLTLLVFLLSSTNIQKTTATPPSSYQNHKTFIKTACNSTQYPEKCYKSLSSYSSAIKSDPINLCITSLTLNLKSAKEATSVISKHLKESQKSERRDSKSPKTLILKDCLEEMKDTVVELKQAIVEMKTIRGSNSGIVDQRIRNVRTWVSSALTDEGTCTDGFEEMEVNKEIRNKVTKVVEELAKTTSNTLALITHLSY